MDTAPAPTVLAEAAAAAAAAEETTTTPPPQPETTEPAPALTPVVLVLSGLPAAGKTTLARCLIEAVAPYGVHICFDELLGPDWSSDREGAERAHRELALAPLVTALAATPSPALVVVDDNMYYRSMRHRVRQLAREHRAAFAQAHVHCDLALAEQRNARRATPVPYAVLRRMAGRMEPPCSEDVPWEQYSVTVSAAQPTSEQVGCVSWLCVMARKDLFLTLHGTKALLVAEIVSAARKAPLAPAEQPADPSAARIITAASTVHQLDVRTRRQLTHLMALYKGEGGPAAARELARALSDERRAALDEARGLLSAAADHCHVVEDVADRIASRLAHAAEKYARS